MNAQPYILVVDDDPAIRRVIVSVLEDEGMRVQSAADGIEALDVCAAGAPSVVVLDLWMPAMDGRSLFRTMRLKGIEAPVLVISAAGAQVGAQELGAEDWLAKPFDVDVLASRVTALLSPTA